MKRRTNPNALKIDPARFAQILAAKKAGLPIPPPLPSEPTPNPVLLSPVEPLAALGERWPIQGMRLSASKCFYFIALTEPFFATLQQCGAPLRSTRHLLKIYKSTHQRQTIEEVTSHPPIASAYTNPFLFLDEHSAIQHVTTTLNAQA